MTRRKATPVTTRSLTIPYDLYERLSSYAKERDVSVNSVIVESIKKFLEMEGIQVD